MHRIIFLHTKNLYKSRKVRLKNSNLNSVCLYLFLSVFIITSVEANRPPRFLIDSQTEIVIRLKEGSETPVGTLIYKLQGYDPDGDRLHFGVRKSPGSDAIRIKTISSNEANIFLAHELDRETRDEYALVLTLTDGRLGEGNFVTQSVLLLVEDVNDNVPIFLPYAPTLTVKENASPRILTTLEAKDLDEGAYGQVVYYLQEIDNDDDVFSISTVNGQGVIRLIGKLDYEKKSVYQLKVLAVDRANVGRVNTGTAALLVQVEDIEDQPPVFISVSPISRISEDAPVGTSVLQVKAIDGDRGVNNNISYSIINENSMVNKQFAIDKDYGILYTIRKLDREESESSNGAYIIKIKATEKGTAYMTTPTATTEVTVLITDVNDETPTFRSKHYECEIDENAQVNSPITFIGNVIPEVFDHDQGNNGTFEMFLMNDNGVFEVTPSQGINEASFLIRVKNSTALDYEKVKVMNFSIVARETVEKNRKSSEVPVVVHIRDRNDNYPEFTEMLYEVSVFENCQVGTTVAQVQAIDSDSGNYGTRGIRYTNLGGSISHLLSLHPVTGVITVKVTGDVSWDREIITRHFLTVEARDNLGHGNRNTAQLVVNIDDVNDNQPIFNQNKYEARLLENQFNFEVPLKLEARDLDLNGTKNSQITYVITEGALKHNFTIDRNTGIINVVAPLDFEQLSDTSMNSIIPLHFIVQARDSGMPSLWSEASVTIYFQDVNDHAPIFEQPFYNRSIPEDLPGGNSVLTVKAFDSDGSAPNNEVVYRIKSGAADKFIIGSNTGIISVAPGASLDPDLSNPQKTKYTLTVLALDGGTGNAQLEATVIVNITIIDVNNKPPVFIDPGTVHIKENTAVGTAIHRVIAKDLDAHPTLRYRLNATNSEARTEEGSIIKISEYDYVAAFDLNATNGLLKVTKILDREKVEVIKLGLIVEDMSAAVGVQIAKATLTVIIEDENDNNPKFKKPFYRRSITENSKNGVNIGNIVAYDLDKNRTITYSLEGPRALTQLLHLDPDTGELVVANKIDHEEFSWLNLSVRATDSGVPRRSSLVDVFIQVLDENDNNPYFLDTLKNLTVPEDAAVGSVIATLEARDADSGDFGKITYLLDRMSTQGKFQLDPDKGELKVAEKLDRETISSYLLVAEAWDNYHHGYSTRESRNAFKQIPLIVTDINDNPPKLYVPLECANITEFHEEGTSIMVIKTSDADDNSLPNGHTEITIFEGNDLGYFSLQQTDYWSAYLVTEKELKGKHGNYTLIIQARDLGYPNNVVREKVCICVTDFNDHPPLFISPPHNTTLRVPENETVGNTLLQVHAEDADIGMNGAVRYRLKTDPSGHYRTFTIDPVSGILQLAKPLNRDVQKIYDIRIEAYDLGVPTALSSDLDLTIYISNVNDYQPQFPINEVYFNFTENESPGRERRQLPDTVDRDELDFIEQVPLPVCYYIVGGNEHNLFQLDPLIHELTVKESLDREKQDYHLLLIKATENCATAPANQSFFDESDDTLLKVFVFVDDVNDNAPVFISKIFTGGVTTESDFGSQFMHIKATDADAGFNAVLSYYLIGDIRMSLSEGLDHLQKVPFLVDRKTGAVQLNFDPQQGMKGYFDFTVLVNDTTGLQDTAKVFIYLLRKDQRVRFVLRQHLPELRFRIDSFKMVLENVTNAIVNIDEIKVHANHDGSVDKTRTDLYLHLVNRQDHSVMDVADVLRIVDQNIEKLDTLFKEYNVLDTQPAGVVQALVPLEAKTTVWLASATLFLGLLLLVCLALCFTQRQSYQRKLKAANATTYGASDLDIRGLGGRVPNTNKHSVEGSNPIWLRAYENEWCKHNDPDEFSQTSERDSLDENVVTSDSDIHPCQMIENNRPQNVYQTLPSFYIPKKPQTTEL